MTQHSHEKTSKKTATTHDSHADLVVEAHGIEETSTGVVDTRTLTLEQQAMILTWPLHTPVEMRSYLKAAAGYAEALQTALTFLEGNSDQAKALRLDPAELKAKLADAQQLTQLADTAFLLYRRCFENAAALRNELVAAMFKINRSVQNTGDSEHVHAIAPLTDWVRANHAHAKRPSASANAGATTKE